MHGRPFVMLVIMRGRVQAFVIQQRSYENLRSVRSIPRFRQAMACRSRTRGRAFRGGVASGRTVRNRLPCGPVRQQAPDCRLEEIVAAGHDEQWRQVDVERQAFGGEELRVGGFDAVEEFDAQHLFESGAAIRIVAYGQFASPWFPNDAEL